MTDTSLTPQPKKRNGKIAQSNELTQATYYLPLQAKRVLWLCLMQTYHEEDHEGVFHVRVADYQRYFNVSQATASTDVKKGVDALSDSSVTFYLSEGEYEQRKLPWLAEAGLKRGRGQWSLEFNYKVMPFLIGLSREFTTYNLYDCGRINSVRVIRLYESLCQFRSSGIWVTTADWMAERYQLPLSQRQNFAEMRRTFINPALKKISENTPISASMTETQEGKLVFTIIEKKSSLSPPLEPKEL